MSSKQEMTKKKMQDGSADDSSERQAHSWVVFEAVDAVVHYLAGEDPQDPNTNLLVPGRSLSMRVHHPVGWSVRAIDSQYKIIDECDKPECLEPRSVFGADYVEKDSFAAPRPIPKTERLRLQQFTPMPDPLEKGQLVVYKSYEAATTTSESRGSEDRQVPLGMRSMCFSLKLPSRELRLMTPTKGRRPLGAERYHINRLAFAQFVIAIEPTHACDSLEPEDQSLLIRSPLVQFFFRLDVCQTPGIKGPAQWKVSIPHVFSSLNASNGVVVAHTSRILSISAQTTAEHHSKDTSLQSTDSSSAQGLLMNGEDGCGEKLNSDNSDSEENAARAARRKRELAPTGSRQRRMPKWREAYVINDKRVREMSASKGESSSSLPIGRQEASPRKAAADDGKHSDTKSSDFEKKDPFDSSAPNTEQSATPAKKEQTSRSTASALGEDIDGRRKKDPQAVPPERLTVTRALEAPQRNLSEEESAPVAATVSLPVAHGPDLTSLLVCRVKRLEGGQCVCPYQGCSVVILGEMDNLCKHIVDHTVRGDLLLFHLLDSSCMQPKPSLPINGVPKSPPQRPHPLPLDTEVKKMAWEDPPARYLEPFYNPKLSYRCWYNHIISYGITDEQIKADCSAVPADRFGMKVCPAQNCKKTFPAVRLEEHYCAHFALCSIQRKRGKRKAGSAAVSEDSPEAHSHSGSNTATPPQAASPLDISPSSPASLLEVPRKSNGRFAKRASNGGKLPRKRPKHAKDSTSLRKRGRPRKTTRAAPAAIASTPELPGLEPGKATAYGSANALRLGALYTAVAVESSDSEDLEMEEGSDCLLIDGISFGAMSE